MHEDVVPNRIGGSDMDMTAIIYAVGVLVLIAAYFLYPRSTF